MRRLLVISLICFQLAMSEAMADVMLIVRRQAEAAGNYVRICDVARVEGPKEQALEVAMTVLGPTPAKGASLEISRWDIESRLFEMGVAARVSFSGNDMVKVFGSGAAQMRFSDDAEPELIPLDMSFERPGRSVAADSPSAKALLPAGRDMVRPAPFERVAKAPAALDNMTDDAKKRIGQLISQYLASRYSRADIEIESHLLSLSEEIPDTVKEVKVVDASGRIPGQAELRLLIRDDVGSEARQVTVKADAELYALAPVAAKKLGKDELLEPGDVSIARVRMESGKRYLPPNVMSVSGRKLSRGLEAGEPLLASEAVPAEAVSAGDIVQSVTQGKAWEIQANAKALGSGMVGDKIQVQDLETKRKYNAVVTGPGRVSAMVGDWRVKK